MIVCVAGRGVSCLSELAGASDEDRVTLANITSLDLSRNAIVSLLKPWIFEVGSSTDRSPLSSASALSCMTGLLSLDVSRNQLYPSLVGIADVAATLVELRVAHNKLEQLDGLENCTSLTLLDISHNSIRSLAGLPNMRRHVFDDERGAGVGGVSESPPGLRLIADFNHLTTKSLFELRRTVGSHLSHFSCQHNKLDDARAVEKAFGEGLIHNEDDVVYLSAGDPHGERRSPRPFPVLASLNLSWNAFLCNGSLEKWRLELEQNTKRKQLTTASQVDDQTVLESFARTICRSLTRQCRRSQCSSTPPVAISLEGYRQRQGTPNHTKSIDAEERRGEEGFNVTAHGGRADEPRGHQSPVVRKLQPRQEQHNQRDQTQAEEGTEYRMSSSVSANSAAGCETSRVRHHHSCFHEITAAQDDYGNSSSTAVQSRLLQELEGVRSERSIFASENKALKHTVASMKQVATTQLETLRDTKDELADSVAKCEVLQRRLQKKEAEMQCLAAKCRELEGLLHQSQLHADLGQMSAAAAGCRGDERSAFEWRRTSPPTLHVTSDNSVLFTTKDLLQCLSINGKRDRSPPEMVGNGFLRNVTNSTLSRSKEDSRAAFGFERRSNSASSSCADATAHDFVDGVPSRSRSKKYPHAHRSYHDPEDERPDLAEQLRHRAVVAKHRIEHELYLSAAPSLSHSTAARESGQAGAVSAESGNHTYAGKLHADAIDYGNSTPRVRWAVQSATSGDNGEAKANGADEDEVRRLREQVASLEATCAEQSSYIDDLSRENDDVLKKYELTVERLVAAHRSIQPSELLT